ncbi:SET domain-containing protein [Marasmius fiardii PR-910]|nr:SET domain-containing protein [Marasmius fiardii PR-910]
MEPETFTHNLKIKGREAYKEVYEKFFELWKHDVCTTMRSLRTQNPRGPVERWVEPHYGEISLGTGQAKETCQITIFQKCGRLASQAHISVKTLTGRRAEEHGEEIPRFISCTPISRTMFLGQLPPFLPFADSNKFSMHKYLRKLRWTPRSDFDADVESLEYEVARVLHFDLGYSYDLIDEMELFCRHRDDLWKVSPRDSPTFLRLRNGNSGGLLWEYHQKYLQSLIVLLKSDFIPCRDHSTIWPRLSTETGRTFPSIYMPEQVNDVFTEVNRGNFQFCPNLNCLLHFCRVHKSGNHPFVPIRLSQRANWLRNLRLVSEGRPECGSRCYRRAISNEEQWQKTITPFNEQETTFIESIVKLEPDIYPCDLAVISRLPCLEVHIYCQRKFLPDDEAASDLMLMQVDSEEEVELVGHNPAPYYVSTVPSTHKLEWDPDRQPCTCANEETCERSPHCICKHEGVFCDRNCRCKKSCGLRFPGCKCRNRCHSEESCVCLRYFRECDPELCIICDARGNNQKGKQRQCQNVKIMTGTSACVEIKRAQYGAGAFAAENIRQGKYIGEYVGELLTDVDYECKQLGNRYRKLNYAFRLDLSTSHIIDSEIMGNETRYLNHKKDDNCGAFERLVNGEPRIGMTATKSIKSGKELVLDYGPNYWEDTAKDTTTASNKNIMEEKRKKRSKVRKGKRAMT